MKNSVFIGFIKVMRPLNLLIIALTMCLLHYIVFARWIFFEKSFYLQGYMHLQLSDLDFALLVFSVVLIAAAGYIINDYFDLRADRINKPEKIIVGKIVKRRVAMIVHFTFNCIGIAIGFYLAWKIGNIKYGMFNVFATLALWFYSTTLKRIYLVGNFTIALLAGLIPIIVAKFDIPLLINEYGTEITKTLHAMKTCSDPVQSGFATLIPNYSAFFNVIYWWAIAYGGFAFLTTLAREIAKDIADIQGDKAVGCHTIPIVMGIPFSKVLIIIIILFILASLAWVKHNFIEGHTALLYFIFAIGSPLIVAIITLLKAETRKKFIQTSTLIKISMIAAVLYTYFSFEG